MNSSGRLPNAVIAGTNKAGTTSLFRYLGDHPAVCVSAVKETAFFRRVSAPIPEAAIREYRSLFAHCSAESEVVLEATPAYLAGGRRTAAAMREIVPDVRLIFVLREPASRLLSDWKRRGERLQPELQGLDGDGFVERLTTVDHSAGGDDPFAAMGRSVRYADRLREFLAFFPPEQMAVRFFDDLKTDARAFMTSICRFLQIDDGFYDVYSFQVENRTRSYRSRWLHRLAFLLNMGMEKRLSRAPRFRNALRRGYNRLNARNAAPVVEDLGYVGRLRDFFRSDNARLGLLLAEAYPDLPLPEWIPSPEGGSEDRADRAPGVTAFGSGGSAS